MTQKKLIIKMKRQKHDMKDDMVKRETQVTDLFKGQESMTNKDA